MAHPPLTTTSHPLSILDAYGSEVRQLAGTIAGFLDVAERRSDLTSAEDVRSLAEIGETVAALQRRLIAYELHIESSSGARALRTEPTADTAPTPPSLAHRLVALAAPAVHGSLAETLGAKTVSREEEMRQWFAAPARPAARPARPGEPRKVAAPARSAEQRLNDLLASLDSKVVMKGTTNTNPMPEVFDLLVRLSKTGCLRVRTLDEQLSFVFAAGMIVATASDNQPTDQYLGEILRQLGLVHRRHITRLVASAQRESKPLGRLLVDEQLLTIPQITKALTVQVQARFARAFASNNAAFAFVADVGTRIDDRISVDASALLAQLRGDSGSPEAIEPPGPG